MKITALLATMAAIMVLTACASAPSENATSTPAPSAAGPAPATQSTVAGKPAPAKAADQVATTGKTKRVCENDDSTGSRLKRPKCRDVPEGNEKAYRDDLLREKEEELRSYNESNALRSASPL